MRPIAPVLCCLEVRRAGRTDERPSAYLEQAHCPLLRNKRVRSLVVVVGLSIVLLRLAGMASRLWLFASVCACAGLLLVSMVLHDAPAVRDRARAAHQAFDAAIDWATAAIRLRPYRAPLGRAVVAVTADSLGETLNWLVFAAHALPVGSGVTIATPDKDFAALLSERGIESYYRGSVPANRSRFWAWMRRVAATRLIRRTG